MVNTRDSLLEGIYNSLAKFLTTSSLKSTYSTITKEALSISGARHGNLLLKKTGGFEIVYSLIPKRLRIIPRKKGYAYQVFKSGKPLVVEGEKIVQAHNVFKNSGLKYCIFIPLAYENKAQGVLTLHFFDDYSVTKEKLRLLQLFGSLASLAIRKTQLNEEIKDALHTRDLFISLAAHELRTPLTALNIYIQMLQKKGKNDCHYLIDRLSIASSRLTKLINELLQVNQIKQGKLRYTFNETDLKEIIQQTINFAKLIHPHHKIIFIDHISDSAANILADSDKLTQAISNILNNSAKFSPPNSQITVSLGYQHPYYQIKIEDQGEGIIRKELNKIFKRFYQGSNNFNGKKGGMGLGLFLSKDIIDNHKGIIRINSQLNIGSIVEISLPNNILYSNDTRESSSAGKSRRK